MTFIASRARRIPRRAVLRGAGVALALPWLEAMMPSNARAAVASQQPRAFFVYFPTGYKNGNWLATPDSPTVSSNVVLPATATALTPFASLLNVILGAGNTPASVGNG